MHVLVRIMLRAVFLHSYCNITSNHYGIGFYTVACFTQIVGTAKHASITEMVTREHRWKHGPELLDRALDVRRTIFEEDSHQRTIRHVLGEFQSLQGPDEKH